MTQKHADVHALLMVAILVMMLIGLVVLIRTPPVEILREVQATRKQVQVNTEIMKGHVEELDDKLTIVRSWIEASDSDQARQARELLYRNDMQKWLNDLKRDNPQIVIPLLIPGEQP